MLTFKEYADHDAMGLAALIARKHVSRQEVLEAAIARLEAVNPRLNAVVHKDYARARAALDAATGPFAGVPFLVKDTNDLAGAPHRLGIEVFPGRNRRAPRHAHAALRRCGLRRLRQDQHP